MRVLFLSYNGLTEPLGRRQVMPYVLGLAEKGWSQTVVSFEKSETATKEARRRVGELLADGRVRWIPLVYHRRPSVPATAFDIAAGIAAGLRFARDAHLVHARSTVPAMMAYVLGRILRVPWIFDVRGLLAEEYADAGHWRPSGTLFRVTDAVERALMRRAGGLVFLTDVVKTELQHANRFLSTTPTAVIPSAVDLDAFRPNEDSRVRVRELLGIALASPVLVYSGSLGSWYDVTEMLRFFVRARQEIPDLRFLILTPHVEEAMSRAAQAGLDKHVVARIVRPDDMPDFLGAADAGICFLRKARSKRASSPTKYGEYLAAGLPVVADTWTGDAARLAGEHAWIGVSDSSDEQYGRAAGALRTLLANRAAARLAARELAAREYDLSRAILRYDALYHRTLDLWARRS